MPEPLTKKQARVYEYIRECITEERYSPSKTEIQKHFGYKSHTSAGQFVNTLKIKGWVSRDKRGLIKLGRDSWWDQ